MPETPEPITFVVAGVPDDAASLAGTRGATRGGGDDAAPADDIRSAGQVKQAVRVGTNRGDGSTVRLQAQPGEDVVRLQIADGPTLVLHPAHARDLLLAQREPMSGAVRGAGGAGGAGGDEVVVDATLRWGGPSAAATRGFPGGGLLSKIEVVTDWKQAVTDIAGGLIAGAVAERFDAKHQKGLYAPTDTALPGPLVAGVGPLPPNGAPLLVLIHGTFSSIEGTFGELWKTDRAKTLVDHYAGKGGAVYALQHPTLRVGPIENALALANALPLGARLHLLTHSRGGLVAEVLARVCANPDAAPRDFAKYATDGGYATQVAQLAELCEVVRRQKIQVDRVVRVAATARGTLLASRRLDAYISVIEWALRLGNVPVAPELVALLGAVASERTSPEALPGLAAQMPGSPLVRWLNEAPGPIPGDLRVVAGDAKGDSIGSWIKTLVADAYFWTDNDFVVQTRSMYGAGARGPNGTFLLDVGGRVSHFSYFANKETAEPIVDALIDDGVPEQFQRIGPLSQAGKSSTGVRGAAARADRADAPHKPAVLLVPGLFGSTLRRGDQVAWPPRTLTGADDAAATLDLSKGPKDDRLVPDGLLETQYGALVEYLARTHDVIPCPFDWTRPIEESAEALAKTLIAAIDAREPQGPPVQILAHEMGGLLVRAMVLSQRTVWDRFVRRPGARVLLLGVPHDGCWTPMRILSGDDTFGGILTGLGDPLRDDRARQTLAECGGLLQLQAALRDEKVGLTDPETWRQLAKGDLERVRKQVRWHDTEAQIEALRWGVPSKEALDAARAFRHGLDEQARSDLLRWADRLVQIVGASHDTPAGYEVGPDGFVYREALQSGDGRVLAASARLPGVATWATTAAHGAVPRDATAFDAYRELLETGATTRLPAMDREMPAPAAMRSSRPARSALGGPSANEPFALPGRPSVADDSGRLRVTVTSGNLKFEQRALMLGHYRAEKLTGTESVMDELTGGELQRAVRAGLYPSAPGSHQIFVNRRQSSRNPWQPPRPKAVVVVGLGEEGKLGGADLVATVRQGVIAWAQRLAGSDGEAPAEFELAATLIASGGIAISAADSARAVAQGVYEAAGVLRSIAGWPQVAALHLIELYLDRATDAWRALRLLEAAEPSRYGIGPAVTLGEGWILRPLDSGYRGANNDFIAAQSTHNDNDDPVIAYSLDTRRARTEVRENKVQLPLVREMVLRASNDNSPDAQIGATLFQLLIPPVMRPYLAGTTELVLEVDEGTAGIPWELLDTQALAGDRRELPWAIRTKLVRKLRTQTFRSEVVDAQRGAGALVIGEPQCGPKYALLDGAREEATAVAELLENSRGTTGIEVTPLIAPKGARERAPDAVAVTNALFKLPWRVLHIAGHGEPPEVLDEMVRRYNPRRRTGDPRGVVLSNGTFLGPREIQALHAVPELVFVNCCYLAARSPDQLIGGDASGLVNRPAFAAGVADALIQIGVRCVIAAGWAVEDRVAKTFAITFYEELLRGQRFIDAVAAARKRARGLGGNTWAAYQCYGDPEWRLRPGDVDSQTRQEHEDDDFAGIATPVGLAYALDALRVQAVHDLRGGERYRARVQQLASDESPERQTWMKRGDVAEAFGHAWKAVGDIGRAIAWYERALKAPDGTASLRAVEQLANLQVLASWRGLEQVDSSESAVIDAARKARTEINEAIARLEPLLTLHPTTERQALRGSAEKRLALVARMLDDFDAEDVHLKEMASRYQTARGQTPNSTYALLNCVAAEIVLHRGEADFPPTVLRDLATARALLTAKANADPDFWSIVGMTEVRLLEAIVTGQFARDRAAIEADFANHHARCRMETDWASVYDQANFVLGSRTIQKRVGDVRASLLDQLAGYAGIKR
ncbi:MAG: CHAT domain-containing protein [Gemmatirosa sp.]|nr:CHAT domain-containing protein [Gemmatirosa sp.]